MHIIFQFPVIDLRPLLPDNEIRLPLPYWPAPEIERAPFVRKFGRLKDRKLGGAKGWSAEEHYCDARLAIKYDNLHLQGFPIAKNSRGTIYKCYRRLYSDGKFMNKMELGFIDDLEKRLYGTTNRAALIDIIRHYCNLKVDISENSLPLYKAGPVLAANYGVSTTYHSKYSQAVEEKVLSGKLNITIVLPPSDQIQMPKQVKLVSEYKAGKQLIKLYGWNLQHEGKQLKVWIIRTPRFVPNLPRGNALAVALRNLRINLLRIHAEKETMRILLSLVLMKKIQVNPGSAQAQLIQSYLKNVAAKLFASTRFNLDQQDIRSFALRSEEEALPGAIDTLEGIAFDFNDQYTRKNISGMADELKEYQINGVLYLTASPKGKYPLDIQKELDAIRDQKERGKFRDNYTFNDEPSVKKDELLRFLNRYQPAILHISLHANRIDGLYFQDETGQPAGLSVSDFDEVLKTYTAHRTLDTVVISACNSKSHATAASKYCKQAIGTNYPVPDQASAVYAYYFYQTLFDLEQPDVARCHDTAVAQLALSGITVPDGTPVDRMFELL